ncbi:hypothetical protein SAY86_015779 [Trapa natans]|uniref:WPP domain-interacting protein 2 n=1 Tax=Trapa natans TaxID=22666 RepID=A0AAN7L8D2_TRANT|nr:hypothetical protein SAY86_015779 [Trapa natans]
MDSASQCSAHESVEENELTPERVLQACDTANSNFSGSYKNENLKPDTESATPVKENSPDLCAGKNSKAEESVGSPPIAKSHAGSSPPTTKGYGLKKWRRIRRDIQKDSSAIVDSSKAMKRIFPSPANPTRPFHSNDAMAGSTSGMRYDGTSDGPAAFGSNMSSRLAAGAESDYSEDRSSKSSTAASVPKFRFEIPSGTGYATGKIRINNLSGKTTSGSEKVSHLEKGQLESSKKQRGDRIKIEKENSQSSGESDSRSSEFVFTHANFSATSNGKRADNHDGECSDDAEESKVQFSEEGQNGYSKQNSGLFDDRSQDDSTAGMPWRPKREKHENSNSSVDRDPLVESILSLQSVQELLEKELQKFSDIPKEPLSPPLANSTGPCDVQLDSQQTGHIPQSFMETQVLTLTEKIKDLETKLEEARTSLQTKEDHISELMTSLSLRKLPKEEQGSGEFEAEHEGIFRQKIEAEIEYLGITRALQKLKAEEQQNMVDGQSKMKGKLGKVEADAALLKKWTGEEVDGHIMADTQGLDEVLSFQKQICKASFYLILQLVLLLVICLLFASRLSPKSAVSLPT